MLVVTDNLPDYAARARASRDQSIRRARHAMKKGHVELARSAVLTARHTNHILLQWKRFQRTKALSAKQIRQSLLTVRQKPPTIR